MSSGGGGGGSGGAGAGGSVQHEAFQSHVVVQWRNVNFEIKSMATHGTTHSSSQSRH